MQKYEILSIFLLVEKKMFIFAVVELKEDSSL